MESTSLFSLFCDSTSDAVIRRRSAPVCAHIPRHMQTINLIVALLLAGASASELPICDIVDARNACDSLGECYTCGGRVRFLMSSRNYPEHEARGAVASQFPSTCSICVHASDALVRCARPLDLVLAIDSSSSVRASISSVRAFGHQIVSQFNLGRDDTQVSAECSLNYSTRHPRARTDEPFMLAAMACRLAWSALATTPWRSANSLSMVSGSPWASTPSKPTAPHRSRTVFRPYSKSSMASTLGVARAACLALSSSLPTESRRWMATTARRSRKRPRSKQTERSYSPLAWATPSVRRSKPSPRSRPARTHFLATALRRFVPSLPPLRCVTLPTSARQ